MGIFNTLKPALLWVDSDTFQCGQVLRYTANNDDICEIPFIYSNGQIISMLTDLGSKPLWSNIIVGDRCDELTLAYVHHDGIFVRKKVLRAGAWIEVDFEYTQKLLDEMCRTLHANDLKRKEIVTAVGIGGRDMYNNRKPLDISKITTTNLTEDFAVLTVRVTPSFEV